MAGSHVETRHCICCGDLVTIHTESGAAHWEALKLKQVITYLGTTKNFGGKQEKWVEEYSDMWAGQTDCHLISEYAFFLGNGAMPWSSKKQHIIASSSTESKYISQTHAAKEAIWLKNFLDEVNVVQGSTIKIHCDNQGVIALTKDNKYHSCTKHIDLRFHFVREAVEEEKITSPIYRTRSYQHRLAGVLLTVP